MQPYKNYCYNSNSLYAINILQKAVYHGFLWEIEGGGGAKTFVHLLYVLVLLFIYLFLIMCIYFSKNVFVVLAKINEMIFK